MIEEDTDDDDDIEEIVKVKEADKKVIEDDVPLKKMTKKEKK